MFLSLENDVRSTLFPQCCGSSVFQKEKILACVDVVVFDSSGQKPDVPCGLWENVLSRMIWRPAKIVFAADECRNKNRVDFKTKIENAEASE